MSSLPVAVSSLPAIVREAARRYAERPLYVAPDDTTFTYAGLDAASEEVARGLLHKGVRPGDVVALCLGSGIEYAIAYAAAAKIGAITAGINERLTEEERRRCIEVASPSLVIAATDEVHQLRRNHGGVGAGGAEGAGRSGLPKSADNPERPVAIVFTSGTTATPKGAVYATRQLEAIAQADGGRRWGGGGRNLAGTSMAHLGYMSKFPQALRSGATTYLMERWSAAAALEMIERHRLTTTGGIPTQVALMLRDERFPATDTSSIELVAMGGGPSTAALVRDTRKGFKAPVVVRYTCTEAGIGTGTDPGDPPEDAETTVGRPRPGVTLSIRDGEVCLASDAVMSGYWRDPDATEAVMTEDGAVRTGDIGYVDELGRLHLSGRIKEMYVRGGYNVYPQEVEGVLVEHPAVAQVAVVPRPDDVMGEIGVAVVVPADPRTPPTLDELRSFARPRLAAHKLPEDIAIATDLPRTAMEKIDRRALAHLVARKR